MKILALGDLHCGHLLGLTPPKYQRKDFELSDLVSEFWIWFRKSVPKKIDYAIWNGDLVEGEGKHESEYHLTTNIETQQKIAIDIIKYVNAKKNIFVYGTPYHTSGTTEYEKPIADHFGEKISFKRKVEILGIRWNIMHTIGKTGTPVGGDIMLKKAGLWSMIYDTIDGRAPADIIIRSHAHEYRFLGNDMIKAFILPALKIGKPDFDRYARRLDGWYNVGFLEFNYNKKTHPATIFPVPHLFKYHVQEGYKKI